MRGAKTNQPRRPVKAPLAFVGARNVLYDAPIMPTDPEIERYRVLLVERRAELQSLSQASAGSRRPVELDQSRVGRLSRMDAMQDQAMAQETARRRELELQRIDAALKRIDGDDYGYCLTCGEEIAEKRLRLDPATPVCIGCAR